jgi:hypothetical protein
MGLYEGGRPFKLPRGPIVPKELIVKIIFKYIVLIIGRV